MNEDYRPRLSILLSEEQRNKLNKLLPWGSGTILFRTIVDELIEVLEEHGHAAIGLIITKKLSMLDFMRIREKEREGQDGPIRAEKKPKRSSAR